MRVEHIYVGLFVVEIFVELDLESERSIFIMDIGTLDMSFICVDAAATFDQL